jgi:hypothetical protein
MGLFNKYGIIASTANSMELPIGAIIMWDGTDEDIPEGWYKCDGKNGTPNLVDKFIMGTNNEAYVGDTGGKESVMLTSSTMPRHRHTFSTSQDGNHNHTFEVSRFPYSRVGRAHVEYENEDLRGPVYGYTEYDGVHSHSTPDTTNEGMEVPNAIIIVPSFMTLIYIMKAG